MILRMLKRNAIMGQIVVVTRWYGCKHLGADRFRHVRECVLIWIAENGV